MSTISQANYDAKKYTICAPFCGSRGLLFRQFADRFLTNVATYDIKNPNDPYTLDETYLGTDDSGEPQGQAAPTSAAAQLRQQAGPSQLPEIDDEFAELEFMLMGEDLEEGQ